MAALLASHLVKRFPGVAAVDDVSLEVGSGEVVGLLGPNGAGKTTTLRMLAGILTPDRGRVTICGIDLGADPLAARQRLGFLSGDTQLYQRLTPVEVLRYFGRLYGMRGAGLESRIRHLVDARPAGKLSGGMKQKLGLCCALIHDPDLLILDEPTTALDVISGQFIVEAIRRERAAGRAVLFSTHIMGEAEYLCDRIYLLHAGRIVDAGPLADLLERSGQTNLTDAFLHHAGRATGAA